MNMGEVTMEIREKELFELHAEVCKALSSSTRLQILDVLQNNELTVGEIVSATGFLKSNISQHLALLKRLGILVSRKQGQKVFYRIADPKITQACILMRDFLMSRIKKSSELIRFSKV
jgi:ArsR family transcriptional regulator